MKKQVGMTKMTFVLVLCVGYCLFMVIFCGIKMNKSEELCLAVRAYDMPVVTGDDVSAQFELNIKLGFYLHILGAITDFSFIFVVRESVNKTYNLISTSIMCIYTLCFVAWIISIHVIRFRHVGKVCSGAYLADGANENGYAQELGDYLLQIIIAMGAVNGFVGIMSAIASIWEKKMIEKQSAGHD